MGYGRGGGRQQYDNNLRGALFENQDRRGDNDPDMKGSCEIDGVEYWISAWWKNSGKVGDYLSIALNVKEQNRGSQPAGNRGNAGNSGRGRPAPSGPRRGPDGGMGYGHGGGQRGYQNRGPSDNGFENGDPPFEDDDGDVPY
jgi:hypothetical protein